MLWTPFPLSLTSSTYLFSETLCCVFGVAALVDDVADLLTVHNEVDAVGGECEEGVVHVV